MTGIGLISDEDGSRSDFEVDAAPKTGRGNVVEVLVRKSGSKIVS